MSVTTLDFQQVIKAAYDPVLNAIRVTPIGGGGGGAPDNASYVTMDPEAGLSNEFVLGTAVIMKGTVAGRPAPSKAGRLYYVTDAGDQRIQRDTGAAWDDLVYDWSYISGVAIVNSDVDPAAGIAESKLALNFPTHAQVHVLAGVGGLGADHTVSGLTAGQVLRASGAASANFQVLDFFDLGGIPGSFPPAAHVLASTVGLGSAHTVSGLTAGQVLRASSAVDAAFAVLAHGDLGGVTANQHHNQSHVLAGTGGLGADHTVSGLTTGQYLRATGAATAAFQTIPAADIPDHASSHLSAGSDSFVLGDEIEATGYMRAWNDGILVASERGINFTDSKSILQNCTDDFVNERFGLSLALNMLEVSIPWFTGDTARRITITNANVFSFSRIMCGIRRPNTADGDDRGYIYSVNVISIDTGTFDVVIVQLDLDGSDPSADPFGETISLFYVVV